MPAKCAIVAPKAASKPVVAQVEADIPQGSLKTPEEATEYAGKLAVAIKDKTLRHNKILLGFLKEFLTQVIEPLKIDDVSDLKNHFSILYNAKNAAKNKVGGKPSLYQSNKKGKSSSSSDPFGVQDASGRGAAGGARFEDDDGVDFM